MNRDALITSAVRFCILALGIATSVFTARALGPAGKGDYFAVIVMAASLVQFGSLGLHASNTYLVSRQPHISGRLAVNSLWLSLATGILPAGVLLIAAVRTPTAPLSTSTIASCCIAPPMMFVMLAGSLLIGQERTKAFNQLQLFAAAAACISILFAVSCGGGPLACIFSTAIAWWLAAGLAWLQLKLPLRVSPRFDWSIVRKCFAFSGKTYLICLLGFFQLKINVLLLKYLSSDMELGYYSIAAQAFDALAIVPTSVGLLLFPQLLKCGSLRPSALVRPLIEVGMATSLLVALAALTVNSLVCLVFGQAFEPATSAVLWVLPAVIFNALTIVLSQYFSASGIPVFVLVIWLAGFLSALGGGLFLIPAAGAVGAAKALSLSTGTVLGLQWIALRLYRPAEVTPAPPTESALTLTARPRVATIRPLARAEQS